MDNNLIMADDTKMLQRMTLELEEWQRVHENEDKRRKNRTG